MLPAADGADASAAEAAVAFAAAAFAAAALPPPPCHRHRCYPCCLPAVILAITFGMTCMAAIAGVVLANGLQEHVLVLRAFHQSAQPVFPIITDTYITDCAAFGM